MTRRNPPIADLTDEALQALLKRAIRDTLILGLLGSGDSVLPGSGWRNAAMLAVGAVISAASILEWQRLIRLFNARLDQQKTPGERDRRGASLCSGSPSLRRPFMVALNVSRVRR